MYESGRETSVKDFVQKAKILEELKKSKGQQKSVPAFLQIYGSISSI